MDDLHSIPREFSLHWGFGAPLEVIDDRDLLSRMAQLKQLASRAPQGPADQMQVPAIGSMSARTRGSNGTEPPAPLAAEAGARRLRSDRPRTAPPGGRISAPRAAAASSAALSTARVNAHEFHARQRRDAAKELAR